MEARPISHFDCHCYLGRHIDMAEGEPETAEQLLGAFDHFGIHEALVPIVDAIMTPSQGAIMAKAALVELGVIGSATVRLPLVESPVEHLEALRAAIPDLWYHPTGGEKPFETAFFTSVARTATLPPADPWYSGGVMNYYYGAWFVLAVPARLLGIVPEVALNLALATTASLVAAVSWSLGTALTHRPGHGRVRSWPGIAAVAARSVGFLAKLVAEAIEEADRGPIEAIEATGASVWQVYAVGILPQVMPVLIGTTVYRWDINVRESSVLGFVGAGGIGQELKNSMDLLDFSRLFTIIAVILIVVTALDWLSGWLRKRLV